MRRLNQEYDHFKTGKLLGRQLSKISEWGGSGEKKIGLVDRLGPFWILSEEMAFQLRPEWRKSQRKEHSRRNKGPEAEANLVS